MRVPLLTINGITKPLSQWVKEYDIYPGTLTKRIKRGMSPIEALTTPVRNYQRKTLTVRGETRTLADWGKKLGTSPTTIGARLHNGYTPEEAVSIRFKEKRETKKFEVDGEIATLSQWAEKVGMNYSTLTGRLNSGMSLKDALKTPIRKRRNSKTYCAYNRYTDELIALDAEIPELSKLTGLSQSTIMSRVSKQRKGEMQGKYSFILSEEIREMR